jgi:hypothetical protein
MSEAGVGRGLWIGFSGGNEKLIFLGGAVLGFELRALHLLVGAWEIDSWHISKVKPTDILYEWVGEKWEKEE